MRNAVWIGLGLVVLAVLAYYAVQQVRQDARRNACKDNLRQIGLALSAYHEEYGSFPPAYIVDAAGRRMHSWRVLILPYLGQSNRKQ